MGRCKYWVFVFMRQSQKRVKKRKPKNSFQAYINGGMFAQNQNDALDSFFIVKHASIPGNSESNYAKMIRKLPKNEEKANALVIVQSVLSSFLLESPDKIKLIL